MPSLALLWADGGYAGKLVECAERIAHVTIEIVRKPLGIRTFAYCRDVGWSSARSRGS
jgi:hypothetical protein